MMTDLRSRAPALAWVAPFVIFMALLVIMPMLPIAQPYESMLRVAILVAALWYFSRDIIATMRVKHALASIALGVLVFLMWIAPDLLFSDWRSHWLFQNAVTGRLKTTIPPAELADPLVMALRFARAALLVPVLEELFWRGWLPRWLVNPDWQQVQLGTYNTLAFLGTAVLFASEHGPYWEVGLACGLIYNWWMWRTKSLGDLVLVHAITNACLSAYVIVSGRYEYWM
jgi:CAAX prenyl protease-like protein